MCLDAQSPIHSGRHVIQPLLHVAYLVSLELGRFSTGPAGVAMLPLAPGLLFVILTLAPPARRVPLAIAAAIASSLSAVIIGHDAIGPAFARGGADAAGAFVGAHVLRLRGVNLRTVWTVKDALHIIEAVSLDAVVAASSWAIASPFAPPWPSLRTGWHLRLITDLFGLSMVVPVAMVVARRRLLPTGRRAMEMVAMLCGVIVASYAMWSGPAYPRPGLLAPFLVWAALSFPLAAGLVNVAFALTAAGTLLTGSSPWAERASAIDIMIGVWLHLIVSGAFLVLSAGVLERRRSQHLMRGVLDGVSDGIIVLDGHDAVRTMNRSAATMFALDGRSPGGLTAQDLLPSIAGLRTAPGDAENLTDVETIAVRSDGRPFPVHVSMRSVAVDDQSHTLVLVHDLSRERETEQSLAMSEAQWQAVLAALPDLIVISDDTGRCVGAHASPHSTIAVAADRLLGHRAADLLAPADATPLEAVRRRVLDTKAPEVLESQVSWHGRSAWIESRVVPLGSNRTLSVLRDVTERRALQDQLRQAQRLEAIGRLAGGVAHDFNNLLTVIGGATELAVDGMAPGDPNRRTLQEVREATLRAAQLTQQLLAFGRRQVLQAEVFDVREVVRGCEQMLRRLIGEHVQLTCQLGERLPCVHADRGQIEQVLVNLVVNARDAMSAGGQLTIRVEAAELTAEQCRGHELRPGPFVALSIIDTGAGIPAAVLEHVFEPFFTTKEPGRGTGLGLATVYGIVQQSGGCVTVASRLGIGTVFAVHLPAVTAPVEALPVRPPVTIADPCGEETILLAEDEPAVRQVTLRFLKAAGYQVVAAESGDEALARLNGHDGAIDLLLTDVVMPGMSGPELATHVQQRHPAVRVLFMSGYPDDALRAYQMPEDAATFIQKPFSRQSLLTAVRGALSPAAASA